MKESVLSLPPGLILWKCDTHQSDIAAHFLRGRLVGAINCQVDSAFEQMKATKRKFGKVDKRQG